MNHKNFNRIQLYLNHKMSGQEKEQFELDLFTDEELRKDYDQQVDQLQVARYLSDETLSEREEQLFEASWKEATAQVAEQLRDEEASPKPDSYKNWLMMGIAVLAIIAVIVFLFQKEEEPPVDPPELIPAQVPLPVAKNQDLKIDTLQSYYGRIHELSGPVSTKEIMLNLLGLLEQKAYPEVLLKADTFLMNYDSTSKNVLFFKAYSLLQLEQPSETQLREALYIFEEKLFNVPTSQMLSPWEVTYFKALCYTRLNNEMAAKAILLQLLQTDCDTMGLFTENCKLYKKEALNLYNSLNQ